LRRYYSHDEVSNTTAWLHNVIVPAGALPGQTVSDKGFNLIIPAGYVEGDTMLVDDKTGTILPPPKTKKKKNKNKNKNKNKSFTKAKGPAGQVVIAATAQTVITVNAQLDERQQPSETKTQPRKQQNQRRQQGQSSNVLKKYARSSDNDPERTLYSAVWPAGFLCCCKGDKATTSDNELEGDISDTNANQEQKKPFHITVTDSHVTFTTKQKLLSW